jgi:hypothetical protein
MEIAIMTAEPMVFKLPETMKIEECLPLDQFIRTTPDCTIHLDGLNVQEFSGLAAQTAAVELLINRLLQSGAERRNLQAKSFGGACMTEHANDIGHICQRFLGKRRNPLCFVQSRWCASTSRTIHSNVRCGTTTANSGRRAR